MEPSNYGPDDQETRSNHRSYEVRTGTKTQERFPTKIENHQSQRKIEREGFQRLSCEDKWKDVLKTLDRGKARWDDSEKTEVPLLEDYKKKSLAHRNPHGGSTPTLLHQLAARHITIRDNLCGDTMLKIIRYLLRNQKKPTNDPKSCEIDEEPILRVALRCENIEFINWIKKASETLEEDFEELIAATDSAKRNCLHYCFNTLLPSYSGTVRSSKLLAIPDSLEPNASSENLSAIQLVKAFIVVAKTETIIAQDQYGNTPLHYALDYEHFRLMPDLYESFAKMMINKSTEAFKQSPSKQFNRDDESPYLYFRKTRAKTPPRKQSTPISSGSEFTPFALNMGESEATVPNDVRKDNTSISSELNANQQEKVMQPPKNIAFGKVKEVKQTSSFSTSSDVPIPTPTPSINQDDSSYYSAASPTSIYFDEELQEGSLGLEAHADSIEEYLKIDYIRTRSEKEAKELLYGKIASDKNLFFDASHLKGESVDQVIDLIDRLSRAGGFEDTLSYVRIPVLSVSNNKPGELQSDIKEHTRNSSHKIEGSQMERMDLVRVFDKLASENVRRILGLFIEDGGSFFHSDAAIERAIQGRCSIAIDGDSTRAVALEVEYWDWKKPDLSLDTIAFAAPNVKKVNLYWSGNWTVLRGWCCPGMFKPIPNLESEPRSRFESENMPTPMLETIHLHAFMGSENPKRAETMIQNFKHMINGWTNNDLTIKETMYSSTIESGILLNEGQDISTHAGIDDEPHQAWLKAMDMLRDALMDIMQFLARNNIHPKPIKLAVIDDGVDLEKLEFPAETLQVTGLSFCSPVGQRERPWHQSDNGHGTTMVNMALRFFPRIELEVMKIQQGKSYSSEGTARTIYAESAAKAIEAAMIRGADIISMSWTIKKPTRKLTTDATDPKECLQSISQIGIQSLCDAIKRAADKNILMFCSAADNVNLEGRDTLPFSEAPDSIFRIGAALEYGQKDPASEDPQNISYYFPGYHVPELRNPRSTEPVAYHDGSSISTALAASFTATLLSMVNILMAYYKNEDGMNQPYYEDYAECASRLRYHGNLRTTLNNLIPAEYKNRKFIPVWRRFSQVAGRINEARDGHEKIRILREFMAPICSNLKAVE